MTTARRVQLALLALAAAIVLPWLWESFACGFCFISRNLAPVAILSVLANAAIGIWTAKRD
jgi:hypothetical protein